MSYEHLCLPTLKMSTQGRDFRYVPQLDLKSGP